MFGQSQSHSQRNDPPRTTTIPRRIERDEDDYPRDDYRHQEAGYGKASILATLAAIGVFGTAGYRTWDLYQEGDLTGEAFKDMLKELGKEGASHAKTLGTGTKNQLTGFLPRINSLISRVVDNAYANLCKMCRNKKSTEDKAAVAPPSKKAPNNEDFWGSTKSSMDSATTDNLVDWNGIDEAVQKAQGNTQKLMTIVESFLIKNSRVNAKAVTSLHNLLYALIGTQRIELDDGVAQAPLLQVVKLIQCLDAALLAIATITQNPTLATSNLDTTKKAIARLRQGGVRWRELPTNGIPNNDKSEYRRQQDEWDAKNQSAKNTQYTNHRYSMDDDLVQDDVYTENRGMQDAVDLPAQDAFRQGPDMEDDQASVNQDQYSSNRQNQDAVQDAKFPEPPPSLCIVHVSNLPGGWQSLFLSRGLRFAPSFVDANDAIYALTEQRDHAYTLELLHHCAKQSLGVVAMVDLTNRMWFFVNVPLFGRGVHAFNEITAGQDNSANQQKPRFVSIKIPD
jgi:hypothetical protein